MARSLYFTACCTRGCELWGTPETIEQHVRERRCRGVAWFRRPNDSVLIQPQYVRVLQAMNAEYLVAPCRDAEGADPTARSRQPYDVWASGHIEQFTTCPVCGETVMKLALHQRKSIRCRTAAAADQVLEVWALGHRDGEF